VYLRAGDGGLPSAEKWGTLGDKFFSFFQKNMDGEWIWGFLVCSPSKLNSNTIYII
jgi:hypothetical protein